MLLIFVNWMEVETQYPSVYTVYDPTKQSKLPIRESGGNVVVSGSPALYLLPNSYEQFSMLSSYITLPSCFMCCLSSTEPQACFKIYICAFITILAPSNRGPGSCCSFAEQKHIELSIKGCKIFISTKCKRDLFYFSQTGKFSVSNM